MVVITLTVRFLPKFQGDIEKVSSLMAALGRLLTALPGVLSAIVERKD